MYSSGSVAHQPVGVYPCSVVCVQICEELGLLHESKNQGKERYIMVTKPPTTTDVEAEDSGGAGCTGRPVYTVP